MANRHDHNKMVNPFTVGSAEHFFWEAAGYSYNPDVQSAQEGRADCARLLANAERQASAAGVSFRWEESDETDGSFRRTRVPYRLWDCRAYDMHGKVVGFLGACDFGPPPASPWSDPYRRVVEAEVAAEVVQ